MTQPHLAAVPLSGELESRERVDRNGVRLDPANVADGDGRAALAEQRAHALAKTGQVGASDRAADGERDRARR